MSGSLLTDELGPRGRRLTLIASLVSLVVLAALVWIGIQRLADNGQLDGDKWEPLSEWAVLRFLLEGLINTLRVALVAMVIASIVGGVMALGRLSRRRVVRLLATAYVEFFRGFPLLLLILFSVFGLQAQGIDVSTYAALVLALAAYNSSIIAEIIRAGIRSLDRGQGEAGRAMGLSEGQVMRVIVLPQALRRMIPALVGQLVVLLKDTSLGYFVLYEELLRRGQITGTFDQNLLQVLFVVALMYIGVNMTLSQFARRLEVRQQRRYRAGAMAVAGTEDLTALAVSAGPKP
jgi:glutamate transport system permease protein